MQEARLRALKGRVDSQRPSRPKGGICSKEQKRTIHIHPHEESLICPFDKSKFSKKKACSIKLCQWPNLDPTLGLGRLPGGSGCSRRQGPSPWRFRSHEACRYLHAGFAGSVCKNKSPNFKQFQGFYSRFQQSNTSGRKTQAQNTLKLKTHGKLKLWESFSKHRKIEKTPFGEFQKSR